MAGIIEVATQSGAIVYAFIRDSTAKIWNGSAFVVYNQADWATYAVAMTEQAGSGYFSGVFPAAIAAGKYSIVIHQQNGGSPAAGDSAIGEGTIYWDGTKEEQGVLQILLGNALPELAAGVPPATPTLAQAVMMLYMALRNKRTATAAQEQIFDNSGAPITKATLSDDSVTTTKEKFGAP